MTDMNLVESLQQHFLININIEFSLIHTAIYVYITGCSNEFCLIHTAIQPNRLDYPYYELTLHDNCEPSLIFTAITIRDRLILCNIFESSWFIQPHQW